MSALCSTLLEARAWPRHAWDAHRLVSMFELAPALALQARGMSVIKADSFENAERLFPRLKM